MNLIKTSRIRQVVIVTSLVTTSMLLIPGMASAETVVSPETLINRSLALAPDNDQVITSTPGATVVNGGAASVTLASAENPAIRFTGVDGVGAGLALPPSHDVRVQALEGGAARAIVVIEHESSPQRVFIRPATARQC